MTELTLPASWYTDASMLDLEKQRVFGRAWQYAGPADWVAEIGDYFTLTIGDLPVVVVRASDGEIRAFANVCCHRGSRIVDGSGNRKTLQCAYHAWTYGLDGALLAAPRSELERDFERSRFSLRRLQAETWGPLVFVNPDPEVAPFAETLASLPEIVSGTGVPWDRLRFRERHEYAMRANWKIVVDNTLECYHCPVAHPSFGDLIDLDDYHLEEHELFSVQGAPVNASSVDGERAAYDARGGVREGLYCFLWPNLMLSVNPGPGNVHTNWTVPVASDRTTQINDFFFVDEVSEPDGKDYVAFEHQVMLEDIDLVEGVDVGLRSGVLDRGQLLLESEHALLHFQRLVSRAVAA